MVLDVYDCEQLNTQIKKNVKTTMAEKNTTDILNLLEYMYMCQFFFYAHKQYHFVPFAQNSCQLANIKTFH